MLNSVQLSVASALCISHQLVIGLIINKNQLLTNQKVDLLQVSNFRSTCTRHWNIYTQYTVHIHCTCKSKAHLFIKVHQKQSCYPTHSLTVSYLLKVNSNKRFKKWETTAVSVGLNDWKKNQVWTGFQPMLTVIPGSAFTKWDIKPTGSWWLCDFVIYPGIVHVDEQTVEDIWKVIMTELWLSNSLMILFMKRKQRKSLPWRRFRKVILITCIIKINLVKFYFEFLQGLWMVWEAIHQTLKKCFIWFPNSSKLF